MSGEVGPGEASCEELVKRYGARELKIGPLRPELRPWRDLPALFSLARAMRSFRPEIVHTHTAKAGMLGRMAALAVRPRPLIVHTYHGHVLEGYFGPLRNWLYRALERLLARITDALIGVSAATVHDLVRLRIAPRAKFRVIPLGLELQRFLHFDPEARASFRRELGAREDVLFTYVGRLVRIKRLDVMLKGFAAARATGTPIRLVIVGDGELRPALERLTAELGLEEVVRFAGYRSDLEVVAAASDAALLTSDNEGTPVSLIEAAAAGRPAVATAVGGVTDVVRPGTGLLAPAGDHEQIGRLIVELATDDELRHEMGDRAREHALTHFTSERLIADVESLYDELLEARRP